MKYNEQNHQINVRKDKSTRESQQKSPKRNHMNQRRSTPLHTQDSHRRTKLRAIVYMQRT